MLPWALNHHYIATIHAIEEYDDDMFMVMECINGWELKTVIGIMEDKK